MVCHSIHFMTIQQIQINSFEACVQERDEEKKWLKGSCTISRSPVVHPGDSALYLGFIEKEALSQIHHSTTCFRDWKTSRK